MKSIPSLSSRLFEWLRTEFGWVVMVIFGCGLAAIGCGGGQSTAVNNIPPGDVGLAILGCPGDMAVAATSSAGAIVTFSGYSAVYDPNKVITGDPQYPLTLSISVSKQSGTLFNLGPTVVTITATLNGYDTNHVAFSTVTACSFTVTVGIGPNPCAPPPVPAPPPGNYPIGTCGQAGFTQVPVNSTPVDGVQGCDGYLYCKSGVFLGTGTTDLNHPECALSYLATDGTAGTAFALSDAQNGGMFTGPIVQVQVPGMSSNVFFVCNGNGGTTNNGALVSFGELGAGLHTVRSFAGNTPDINNILVPDLKLPIGLAADGYGRAWVVAKSGGANGSGGIASIFWNGTGYKLIYSFSTTEFPMFSPVVMTVAGRVTVCVSVLNLTTRLHSVLFIDADGGTHSSVGVVAGPIGSPNPPNDSRCSPLVSNGDLYVWNGPRSSVGSSNNPCRLFKVLPPIGTSPGNATLIATLPSSPDQTVINSAVGPDQRVYTVVSDASGSYQNLQTTPLNGSAAVQVFSMLPNSFVVNDSLNFSTFTPDTFLDTGAALIAAQDGSGEVISSVESSGDVFAISPDSAWPAIASGRTGVGADGTSQRAVPGTKDQSLDQQGGLPDVITGGTFHPLAIVTVPNTYSGLNAARGLALNGDLMLVGVPFGTDANYSGAVHVFRRVNTTWTLESTLAPPVEDNTALFGFSVAMSQDTAVVGAPGSINAATRAGSAYVFRLQDTNWTKEARLTNSVSRLGDEFGAAVAIDVDSIIVGAPGATNGGPFGGRAYISQRVGTNWSQKAALSPAMVAAQDYFGASVAIRGTNALVGAPRSDSFKQTYKFGAAFAYRLTGATWAAGPTLTNLASYSADLFGATVAVGDGFFVVGAPGMNPLDPSDPLAYRRGVHVFINNRLSTTLIPASPLPLEMFGASVSLDGSRITVGAPRALETNSPPGIGGAGYVFDYRGGAWYQSARLIPDDPQGGDLFGLTVAASSNWVAVSAVIHTNTDALIGSAYAFEVVPLSAPILSITPIVSALQLDWSPGFGDFVLESNSDAGSTNWAPVMPAPTTNSFIVTPSNAAEYFRLHLYIP